MNVLSCFAGEPSVERASEMKRSVFRATQRGETEKQRTVICADSEWPVRDEDGASKESQ